MRFFLRLTVVLAFVLGGWFWWQGHMGSVEEQSLSRLPFFVQNIVRRVLTVEKDIRHRVQMVQSGALMMKEGKAMIEGGVRGRK